MLKITKKLKQSPRGAVAAVVFFLQAVGVTYFNKKTSGVTWHVKKCLRKSNYQGASEEFIFGIVLPEEESTVAVHRGLDLNHQLVVF